MKEDRFYLFDIKKAAKTIKEDPTYVFIFRELKKISGKNNPSTEELAKLLEEHPKLLEDYKEINTQSEISNIQLAEQEISPKDSKDCIEIKERLNKNIHQLKALEAFEKKPEKFIYAIWISSAYILLIFMLHNILAMYTYLYEKHPIIVILLYMLVIGMGFNTYRKRIKRHLNNYQTFQNIYEETKKLIKKGLKKSCFKETQIYE